MSGVADRLRAGALHRMGLGTVARLSPALLRAGGQPRSSSLLRRDDVDVVVARSPEEIDLQLDGEHLGLRRCVRLTRVGDALEVVAPPR